MDTTSPVIVDNQLFLGRAEEHKQFLAATGSGCTRSRAAAVLNASFILNL